MGRSPACSPEEKLRIVLDVIAGRITLAQAAAEAGVSTTAISNWKRQFLHAGRAGLAAGTSRQDSRELAALEAENKRLAEQVRDTAVEVKVWKLSARNRREDR